MANKLTIREALKAHNAAFFRASNCDAWMAAERQLVAYMSRTEGAVSPQSAVVANTYADARYYMGVTDQDQFYA